MFATGIRLSVLMSLAFSARGYAETRPGKIESAPAQEIRMVAPEKTPSLFEILDSVSIDPADTDAVEFLMQELLPSSIWESAENGVEIVSSWIFVEPQESGRETLEVEGYIGEEAVSGELYVSQNDILLWLTRYNSNGEIVLIEGFTFRFLKPVAEESSSPKLSGAVKTASSSDAGDMPELPPGFWPIVVNLERAYISCKCDAAGGTGCTTTKCDDLAACQTVFGSCAHTAFAQH